MATEVLGSPWYCAALRRASAMLEAIAGQLERAGTARLALEPVARPCREEELQDLRHRIDARYY